MVDDLDVTADHMFTELVGEPRHRTKSDKVHAPDVKHALASIIAAAPLLQDVQIHIPGKTIAAPVAYRNGRINYIVGEGFPARVKSAIKQARDLGADGNLVADTPSDDRQAQHLIVLARFPDRDVEAEVRGVLHAFKVDVFSERESDTLVEKVRAEAHT